MLGNFSAYDFITNFVPGVVFAAIATLGSQFDFTNDNVFIGPSLYFFFGVVASRLGSLIVEPVLIASRFIARGDYNSFLIAEQNDKKIQPLMETCNFYRTQLTSLLCIVPLLIFFPKANPSFDLCALVFFVVSSALIFAFSLRKQSQFLKVRIEHFSQKGNQ